MAITRANVEAILINRCGALLTQAGLDGTTHSGANADLNDAIGYAIRKCGSSVSSITAVADADLGSVSSDDYDKLLDLAELRTLETILGNLDDVDITVGQRSERLSQLAEQVAKKIERKRTQVESEYGIGGGALQVGVLTLDFATKGDDDVIA